MTLRGPIAPSIMKKHPLTGEPIEPVGVVGNKYVWPVMGGAPVDDEDDDDQDDDGDSGADGKKADDDDGDSGSDDDGSDKVSRADLVALEKRMKAADRRAEAAEKALKEKTDAEKGELQKAQDDLKEVQAGLEDAQKVIQSLRLENAFLTANKHTWHEPETALNLAQSAGYLDDIMDEDGKVDKPALTKALDRLAKDKKYLVKTDKKEKDDEDAPPSGQASGGRSDNAKDKSARQQQLRGRFQSLNR